MRVAYELVPGLIAMLRDIDDDALFVNGKSIPVSTPDDMPTWPSYARQTSHGL